MSTVKERIALLNAKANKKDEPAAAPKKGPPPPKVDIKEKPYVAPVLPPKPQAGGRPSISPVAGSAPFTSSSPASAHAMPPAARDLVHDAPRERVASVFRGGEKSSDVRHEVSARILSMKLFPGLRDVVLSDYSAEEHETLRTVSSGLMASVMETAGENETSPVVEVKKEVAPPSAPAKAEPPPPTAEEIAMSERAAWFLAASETLDDSKPLPKVNFDDDDDDRGAPSTSSLSKGAKSKADVEASRQLVKDRMAAVVGGPASSSSYTASGGNGAEAAEDKTKKKKEKTKLPEVPQWQDTAWSPAYKVEGKQAHAATMSAGVAKSVIEQLQKRPNAPQIANAGFLAVTSLSLHSPVGSKLWKDLDASKVVLNCLNIHSRDSELAFNGLAAVAGLARSEAEELMDADAATAILLTMQVNSTNARVVEQGCVTLSFLAGNNSERIRKLKEAHVPAVIESLKQMHGKDPTCAFAFIALNRALKD